MENSYFIRITHPYEVVERVINAWESKSAKIVCYEHVGESTRKVHCHIAIASSIGIKQLRRLAEDAGIPMSGNENSSSKTWKDGSTLPLTYMSKGKLNSKFRKGYTEQEEEEWRGRWLDAPVKRSIWTQLWDDYSITKQFTPPPKQWMTPEEFLATTGDPQTIVEARQNDHKVKVKLSMYRFINNMHDNTWCPQTVNQIKCLQNTYEMRYGFSLA